MKKLIYVLRKSQRNNMYYAIFIAQILFIVAYIFASKNLVKPAGAVQAFYFLFKYPGEYFLSVLFGIVAWIICCCIILSVLREVPIVKELTDEDDGRVYYDYRRYEYLDDIPRNKYIIYIIISLVSLIINFVFVKYLFSLLFLLAIAVGIMLLYGWLSTNR